MHIELVRLHSLHRGIGFHNGENRLNPGIGIRLGLCVPYPPGSILRLRRFSAVLLGGLGARACFFGLCSGRARRCLRPGKTVRVCVASGLHNVKRVLDGIRDGSLQYDFVEFMACPGGCINGGGQPIQHANVRNFTDIKALRAAALYKQDEGMTYRRSHENPVVQKVYADFLGEPGQAVNTL